MCRICVTILTFIAESDHFLGSIKFRLKEVGPASMICDITNALEADPGPITSRHNMVPV